MYSTDQIHVSTSSRGCATSHTWEASHLRTLHCNTYLSSIITAACLLTSTLKVWHGKSKLQKLQKLQIGFLGLRPEVLTSSLYQYALVVTVTCQTRGISSCFPSPNHRVSLKSCRSCCSCAIQHKQKDHGTGHHKLIAIRCNPGKQTHKPTRRRRVRHCERTERTCNKEIQKIIPIETSSSASHRHVPSFFSNRDTKGCSFGAWNHPGRSWS